MLTYAVESGCDPAERRAGGYNPQHYIQHTGLGSSAVLKRFDKCLTTLYTAKREKLRFPGGEFWARRVAQSSVSELQAEVELPAEPELLVEVQLLAEPQLPAAFRNQSSQQHPNSSQSPSSQSNPLAPSRVWTPSRVPAPSRVRVPSSLSSQQTSSSQQSRSLQQNPISQQSPSSQYSPNLQQSSSSSRVADRSVRCTTATGSLFYRGFLSCMSTCHYWSVICFTFAHSACISTIRVVDCAFRTAQLIVIWYTL